MNALLFSLTLWLCQLQVLLFAALVLLIVTLRIPWLSYGIKKQVTRIALASVVLGPFVTSWLPEANVLKPAVQVGAQDFGRAKYLSAVQVTFRSAPSTAEPLIDTDIVLYLGLALCLVSLICAANRIGILWRDRRRLSRLLAKSFEYRKLGRVSLLVSPGALIPFATRKHGRALVVIPQDLFSSEPAVRFAVKHELQHHRQGDLGWSLLLVEAVRSICGWNPLVRSLIHFLEELDELACDEALLGRQGLNDRAYATCLLRVAESAVARNQKPRERLGLAGTAGMSVSPTFLKRRINMILSQRSVPSRQLSAWSGRVVAACVVVATGALAWASNDLVSDHRLTEATVVHLARRTQAHTGIPVVVNRRVVEMLNRATSTPRARFWMRNSLKRMHTYEAMVTSKLAAASLPSALLALPLMESGYQNTESPTSAGIWQFIPQTARVYGLQVDDTKDERLNAERETTAAVAYLANNASLFKGDWNLALLGYNAGEKYVSQLVQETGDHDVFRLADEGRLNQENASYVPKFMAALIVLDNPDLVRE